MNEVFPFLLSRKGVNNRIYLHQLVLEHRLNYF